MGIIRKKHYMDPYWPTRIQWKVKRVLFVGSVELPGCAAHIGVAGCDRNVVAKEGCKPSINSTPQF